jgi:acetyl-CoA carboxylase carboxyltransferase component
MTFAATAARMSPSEHLEALCDEGSVAYLRSSVASRRLNGRSAPGDGVVTAAGSIEGRPVVCYAQDSSFMGGSMGEAHADSVLRLLTLAEQRRVPVISCLDSAGARLQEGVAALAGYARIFRMQVALRGLVPQIALVSGTCAGGSSYSPALADFVIMRDGAAAFLTGPKVVREVMREDVSVEELGGLSVHRRNGVCDFAAKDDRDSAAIARQLLGYVPQSAGERSLPSDPCPPSGQDPAECVPVEPRRVYDVRAVLRCLFDGGDLLEAQPDFAPNIVTGFGRIEGRALAFVANQPKCLGGVIDGRAAEKAASFLVRTSALGLPLVTIVDTPGFLPGSEQESAGIIRYGAEMLRAFADASVPRITVILRKAYGGAYITMNSRDLGAHLTFAWPGAQVGVMGAGQAVALVHHRELVDSPPELRDQLAEDYATEHLGAQVAARDGFIDEIIEPSETRHRLGWALQVLDHRRRRRSDGAADPLWGTPAPDDGPAGGSWRR